MPGHKTPKYKPWGHWLNNERDEDTQSGSESYVNLDNLDGYNSIQDNTTVNNTKSRFHNNWAASPVPPDTMRETPSSTVQGASEGQPWYRRALAYMREGGGFNTGDIANEGRDGVNMTAGGFWGNWGLNSNMFGGELHSGGVRNSFGDTEGNRQFNANVNAFDGSIMSSLSKDSKGLGANFNFMSGGWNMKTPNRSASAHFGVSTGTPTGKIGKENNKYGFDASVGPLSASYYTDNLYDYAIPGLLGANVALDAAGLPTLGDAVEGGVNALDRGYNAAKEGVSNFGSWVASGVGSVSGW